MALNHNERTDIVQQIEVLQNTMYEIKAYMVREDDEEMMEDLERNLNEMNTEINALYNCFEGELNYSDIAHMIR